MNERIRKFLNEATSGLEPDLSPQRTVTLNEMEKFAELIVRECLNAVCDPRTTYLESITDASAMYTARERIRKHFGS